MLWLVGLSFIAISPRGVIVTQGRPTLLISPKTHSWHKATAGYNKEGYISLLKRNLSPRVLEHIYALENVPTMYDAWKTYAQHFDSNPLSTPFIWHSSHSLHQLILFQSTMSYDMAASGLPFVLNPFFCLTNPCISWNSSALSICISTTRIRTIYCSWHSALNTHPLHLLIVHTLHLTPWLPDPDWIHHQQLLTLTAGWRLRGVSC